MPGLSLLCCLAAVYGGAITKRYGMLFNYCIYLIFNVFQVVLRWSLYDRTLSLTQSITGTVNHLQDKVAVSIVYNAEHYIRLYTNDL